MSLVDNRVEVLVHALRGKLKKLESSARIETVRGVGYRLMNGQLAG